MANAHSFPLLKLPNNEQIRVLRNMQEDSILFFSLLSKRAKALIKSVELKADQIYLLIGEHLTLFFCRRSIVFYSTDHQTDQESVRMLCKPENVAVLFYTDTNVRTHYYNLDMEFKDWIDHVLFIYNRRKLKYISFGNGYERFDLEAIKKIIPFYERVSLDRQLDDASANMLLNTFPYTNELMIYRNIFGGNQLECRKLFIQNFKFLVLGHFSLGPFESFGINDLLMCNSEHLRVHHAALSEKEVNRFLKLWVKGANSQLDFVHISLSKRTMSQDQVIQGLNCKVVNTRNQFINGIPILGGFDIYRHDGIRGTIIFTRFIWPVVELHVYHG